MEWLRAQVVTHIWGTWHGLLKAWEASQQLPEDTARIIGIAMVDGLRVLGLLAGPLASRSFETAEQTVHVLLSHSASSRFLLMLNPCHQDQVSCHPSCHHLVCPIPCRSIMSIIWAYLQFPGCSFGKLEGFTE